MQVMLLAHVLGRTPLAVGPHIQVQQARYGGETL